MRSRPSIGSTSRDACKIRTNDGTPAARTDPEIAMPEAASNGLTGRMTNRLRSGTLAPRMCALACFRNDDAPGGKTAQGVSIDRESELFLGIRLYEVRSDRHDEVVVVVLNRAAQG